MQNMLDMDVAREWRRERLAESERAVSYGLQKRSPGVFGGFLRSLLERFGYDAVVDPVAESSDCRRGRRKMASRRRHLDIRTAQAKFEAAVRDQVSLTSSDPAVEAAGRALLAVLGPASRQFAWELAEQAAVEMDAQLPYDEVEVTLRDGEPVLRVRQGSDTAPPPPPPAGEYEARITLRLPAELKNTIEEAARKAGDSVNSYLVKDIARLTTNEGKTGKKMRGKLRT